MYFDDLYPYERGDLCTSTLLFSVAGKIQVTATRWSHSARIREALLYTLIKYSTLSMVHCITVELATIFSIFNPLRMHRRVTVVCVCVCVCLSVTALVVSLLSYIAQLWYQCIQYHNSKVFNSWILLKLFCSKVIALFKLTFACSQPFFQS